MKNNKEEIVSKYVGYVEIILSEGEQLTLDQAIQYADDMYKEDTTRWMRERSERFYNKKALFDDIKKELINLGLKN